MDYKIVKPESVENYLENYKEGIYELIKQGVKEGALYFIPYPAMEQAVGQGKVLVAYSSSDVVLGFLYFNHRKDGITRVYSRVVHNEYRRQGIGTALQNAIFEEAKSLGQHELTTVGVKGSKFQGYFEAVGYKDVATMPGKKREIVKRSLQIAPKQQKELFDEKLTDTENHQG